MFRELRILGQMGEMYWVELGQNLCATAFGSCDHLVRRHTGVVAELPLAFASPSGWRVG